MVGSVRVLFGLAKPLAMEQKAAPAPLVPTIPGRLTVEQQQTIVAELTARKVIQACPRCATSNFTLSDQITKMPIQGLDTGVILGGSTIPCVVTYCVNCGYVALHALGVLGFLTPDGSFGKL